MEFIIADKYGNDLAVLPEDASMDLEIGGADKKNDFELKISTDLYDPILYDHTNFVYAHGTEYGGILGDMKVSTRNDEITFSGDSWRGLLAYSIVEPPAGQDYLIVSGELNSIVRDLVGTRFDDIFQVSTESTGVSVTNYQIDRYVTVLDAVENLLKSVNHKLVIAADGHGRSLKVLLFAEAVNDYSAVVEVSQDDAIDFDITKKNLKYEYILAAGKGELKDREIVKIHLKADGTTEQVQTIPDKARVWFYDYPTIAEDADLLEEGSKKFEEINSTDTQNVSISDDTADYYIGDIVGGRDYITGIFVAEPITSKVVKYKDGKYTIDYKLGG